MQFKMSENSLFAHLLRQPWWVSIALAVAVGLGLRALLPEKYVSIAIASSFPFLVAGVVAARKQWDVPSAARVARTVEAISAMSWREFSDLMEKAFQRDGYRVTRIDGAADFAIEKAGRKVLVCCKRWKAASHGVEPLRDLEAAREAEDAREALYVAVNNPTDKALKYAKEHKINLMLGLQLAKLLRLPRSSKKS